jgi:hypothetical protein
MKFTTHLGLHSQASRLVESGSYAADIQPRTGLSPSQAPSSNGLGPAPHAEHASIDHNSLPGGRTEIFGLSSSRFTRRY